MSKIEETFRNLKEREEGALIAYVTGGDPTPEFTPKIVGALIAGGADIVELGIPFSDPIADGPTIQAATVRALRARTTPKMVLEMAREIKKDFYIPTIILTYYNPIFRMNPEKFLGLARNCNIDGIIVPDLPFEEAYDYKRIAETNGIDTIFIASPSTSLKRLEKIIGYTSGFLYLVSLFGVTGAREEIQMSTIQLIKRVATHTAGRIPLAVGFGISKPGHVKTVIKNGADGAIVGSTFVEVIERNLNDKEKTLRSLEQVARKLKKACRNR